MNIYIKMYLQWQFFICIPLLLIIIGPTTGESWDYHNQGPDLWSDTYPLCDGRSQSPIIIKTACTNYRKFTPFSFTSAYDLTHDFTLINDGNNIIGTYNYKNSSPLKLTGGGLNGTYYFLNFHLHWGENYKSGSEHQM
jgi:carbonic anhydrase